jgi:hypothetical protein
MASLAPKTPLARRVSLQLALPGPDPGVSVFDASPGPAERST